MILVFNMFSSSVYYCQMQILSFIYIYKKKKKLYMYYCLFFFIYWIFLNISTSFDQFLDIFQCFHII